MADLIFDSMTSLSTYLMERSTKGEQTMTARYPSDPNDPYPEPLSRETQDANDSLRITNRPEKLTTYDSKCYDLASWFLDETPACGYDYKVLASRIQRTVEDFLDEIAAREDEEASREPYIP